MQPPPPVPTTARPAPSQAVADPTASGAPLAGSRARRLLLLTLSLGGWAVGVGVMAFLVAGEGFHVGIDLATYIRAGADLLAGRPVYVGQIGDAANFPYAPPWAVLFAALAWVPDLLLHVVLMVLNLLAIRYVAGSWVHAGLVFWYPVSAMLLNAGNIEFLIAASIVLAARGQAGPLGFMALAKIAPALAIPPARWRQAALVAVVAVAVTLPWWHLWGDWIAYLLRQPTETWISVGPPWYLRLPVALALLLLVRRPWASALAVVIAMPSMYLSTFTILIAVVRLWLDRAADIRTGSLAAWLRSGGLQRQSRAHPDAPDPGA